jgi:hypothetical protein
MKNRFFTALTIFSSLLLIQCKKDRETLFKLTDPEQTGIHFSNTIIETDSLNILSFEYIYNGGGVAAADFNNDGLQDIFFTGNQVPNTLYLNQGKFSFKDITNVAHVNVKGRWNSGVAVVDINNDGWMDLYVCATTHPNPEERRNMLFVNQGLSSSGDPVFKEMAADYKIDYDGHSIMAAFFDYDKDDDLDLYILENQKLDNLPTNYRARISDGTAANNDRLFRNENNGTFTDVTVEAGITYEGFGLGLAIADLNKDGWPDIYVSNDYLSNDILYINNQDGTFQNSTSAYLGHQSQFSMGNDAADINNDAMPDIITLDMLPEINARKKTTIGNKSYLTYINNEKYGYEYQYVRNMLHLNNGLTNEVKFSEIGQLSGIYQTEWSWSPLFADFDNDGNKDLIITNGFPKDITDKDFANYRADVGNVASNRMLLDSIPVIKIPNYAFKNNGDLSFSDMTKTWGMDKPSFSNGAAFADLDNDGDLDYIVNNINDKAFVYENTLYTGEQKPEDKKNNFLRITLKGNNPNRQALGTKVTLYYDSGNLQYAEQSVYRGFLSSVEEVIHFGLGTTSHVDSILIQWPDGNTDRLQNIKANQTLVAEYKQGTKEKKQADQFGNKAELVFTKANSKLNVLFKHEEEDKIDFNLQRTLPHKFSQAGPGLSVGDIDNDGLEDFIVGGSTSYEASIYKQKPDGTFSLVKLVVKDGTKNQEDEGLLLFDADNDGDLDLYIVSGSIESQQTDVYQDRLYLNDGNGNFSLNASALPEIKASGSCVRAADYDRDGDLDLFIGGRIVPGSYPNPAESYLLRNDKGKFTNVTKEICVELQTLGMITDGLWTDYNQDGKLDLAVVGEFMPITFFTNDGVKFVRLPSSGIERFTGWWNSITGGDFDSDGDVDFIAGNLGLNNNFQVKSDLPLKIFAKDFDGNGSIDPILACYMRESMESEGRKLYPIHFWDELNSQSTKFRNKFSRYKQYSKVTIDQVLTPEDLSGALILEANHMESSFVENLGGGKFSLTPLPRLAQVAPLNGMVTTDVNEDGNLDVVLVGNDYGNEVFAGRYDALSGLVLVGNGKGSFEPLPSARSGFYVKGDAKALVKLQGANGNELFIASQNKDSLQVFVKKSTLETEVVNVEPMESWAEIIFKDGRKQKVEFYYGSGYLSQSSRTFKIPRGVREVVIYDYKGNSRKVELGLKDSGI